MASGRGSAWHPNRATTSRKQMFRERSLADESSLKPHTDDSTPCQIRLLAETLIKPCVSHGYARDRQTFMNDPDPVSKSPFHPVGSTDVAC